MVVYPNVVAVCGVCFLVRDHGVSGVYVSAYACRPSGVRSYAVQRYGVTSGGDVVSFLGYFFYFLCYVGLAGLVPFP